MRIAKAPIRFGRMLSLIWVFVGRTCLLLVLCAGSNLMQSIRPFSLVVSRLYQGSTYHQENTIITDNTIYCGVVIKLGLITQVRIWSTCEKGLYALRGRRRPDQPAHSRSHSGSFLSGCRINRYMTVYYGRYWWMAHANADMLIWTSVLRWWHPGILTMNFHLVVVFLWCATKIIWYFYCPGSSFLKRR